MIYNYSPLHPFMYRQQHSLLWYLRLRTQVMPQLNSTRQGHALLVLIPNSTVNCVITYTITGVDIKYGQKSIVDSVSYTTGSCKMMFHKSHLICICLLRPLQVVIQFLVRASPKSRAGRVGLVIICHYSTFRIYALTLKLHIDQLRWTQLLKGIINIV